MFLFFSNSNSIRQNYKFLEINVILLELNRVTEKKSCCFATSQIIVHACKIAFATSKFNGEMVLKRTKIG